MTPFDAQRLVMSRCMPSNQKYVLLVLALYVDEAWSCFPGQARLAANTSLHERTVRRALTDLEESGLIVRKARYGGVHGRTSDRYFLIREAIEALPEAVMDQPDNLSGRDDLPGAVSDLPGAVSISTGQSARVTTSRTTREHPESSTPSFDGRNLYAYWAALIGFPSLTDGQKGLIDKYVALSNEDFNLVAGCMAQIPNPRRPKSLGEVGDLVKKKASARWVAA